MSRILVCIPFLLFFALLYPRSQPEPELDAPPERDNKEVAAAKQKDPLPDSNVVRFLEKCLARYDRDIKTLSGTMYKQERVKKVLHPAEVIHFDFREKPFSVYMKWIEGAGDAAAAMYVQGENDNKLLAQPKLLPFLTWREDPRGTKATDTARYTIDEFGIRIGTERTYKTWKKKQEEGKLFVEYEGVEKVAKAGNRDCYVIHRSKMTQPEDDGVLDVVLYIDKENWLQVGSTLRGAQGKLIADYFFRDLVINPKFAADHFNSKLLHQK